MKRYDVIVAGSAAAIAAARAGLTVLLVEKSNCLGGAATNCLVEPFMKYWTQTDDGLKVLSGGYF